jgi:peptidoglycan/xylan/chitin deacetylase (PgdA/CDA1 family)
LIELGGHTDIHPILTSLSSDEQYHEIMKGKAYLDTIQCNSVTNFAYPYGDYTMETISMASAAGFDSACIRYQDSLKNFQINISCQGLKCIIGVEKNLENIWKNLLIIA